MPNIEEKGTNKYQLRRALRNEVTIGLFGTCGGSTWRDKFIERYDEEGIEWFNPQKADWKPEDMELENVNLNEDDIILFPITSETYGTGSLGETGFSLTSSIARAASSNKNQRVVFFIAPDVDEKLAEENPAAAKESRRARKLVASKIKINPVSNVYEVSSLEEMLEISLQLYKMAVVEKEIRKTVSKVRESERSEYQAEMFEIVNENEGFRNALFSLPDSKRSILLGSLDFMDYIMEHKDDARFMIALSKLPEDKLQILAKHPEKIEEIVDFELTHEEIMKAHGKEMGGMDR